MEKFSQQVPSNIEVNIEEVDSKLVLIDRLINWEASLTSREKFRELLLSGKKLRIKFGADITAQTLHIGHAVNLRVMRHLQDLGHKVVFLLGGFTTLIGDPTDKLQARTAPDNSEIEKNKVAFIDQIKGIIRFDDPELIEVRDNTEWWGNLEKGGYISVGNFFEMLKRLTLSQMMSRDMFRKRLEAGTPIYMSEFLYPVLQGYDSVELSSDLTVVGSDQMFNEKMAWVFQEASGQERQAILCTKITPGLDGGEKQSKSIGNYVGLAHTPKEKFNRVMLLLDDLIPQWFEVYTETSTAEIESLKEEFKTDPISFKRRLAYAITELFHGKDEALLAEVDFSEKKLLKKIPAEIEQVELSDDVRSLDDLLRKKLGHKTNSIKDLLGSKAVSIVTKVNSDGSYEESLFDNIYACRDFTLAPGCIIRVGKNKFIKIR